MAGMGFWSLCFLLVLPSSAADDDEAANRTVRIGYLARDIDYAGAINVAIQHAQNDGLMRDYNFRYNAERESDENYSIHTPFRLRQSPFKNVNLRSCKTFSPCPIAHSIAANVLPIPIYENQKFLYINHSNTHLAG